MANSMARQILLLILGACLWSPVLHVARAAPSSASKSLVLYNAGSGALPAPPLLSYTDFPPGAAAPVFANEATVLDTTTSGNETYSGWVALGAGTPGFPILDRTAGFQVNFTMQIDSESHGNDNRAGFSTIVLGNDAKGVELAFWQNEIWSQGDQATGGLFRHAEGIAYATSNQTDYQITIVGETYTLSANAQAILSGPVRDYSAFEGFPDPYETPNFFFLGDNTTSARARVQLYFVSVTGTGPEPVTPAASPAAAAASTSIPSPSFTQPPSASATPLPSPTPPGTAFEICSSGWIFLGVPIAAWMAAKRSRARS